MGTKLGYWEGYSQAVIEESQLYTDWKYDSINSERLKFMNNILAFWYNARHSGSPYQSKIDEMLDDAGTEGLGSSDFENFLGDYESNGFVYRKYNDLATYFGGNSTSLFYHTQIRVPVAFKHFAETIEEKLEPLKGNCEQFYNDANRLNELFQKNDWTEIHNVLEKIDKYSERAQKFLWVYPKANRAVSKIISYNTALSKIHGYLTDYADLMYGRRDLAVYALQKAVSFVPVLGSYYGAMVDLMPMLKDWFSDLIEKRCRLLDAAARGYIPGQN